MQEYHVGKDREQKSLMGLFLQLKDDESDKTIYLDPGVYDIFAEYRQLGVPTPADDVASPDYFDYNVFLPPNTRLIGIGDVVLRFAPTADQITYGESRTWSPLNIMGGCHIENIEIFCVNSRYCIHDDGHNRYKNTRHTYKNVRCTYQLGDMQDGRRLGYNNTIGNGMAQGAEFLFEDCVFRFIGGNHSAFYTHESGKKDPENSPTLTFRNCQFIGSADNDRVLRLQNLATADLHIPTLVENCTFVGGIYLTIYRAESAQHYDVTLINSGNPPLRIDRPEENKYPVHML